MTDICYSDKQRKIGKLYVHMHTTHTYTQKTKQNKNGYFRAMGSSEVRYQVRKGG